MKMNAILLIDVGNTATTCAYSIDGDLHKVKRLSTHNSDMATINNFLKEYLSDSSKLDGVCLSSVVPEVTMRWANVVYKFLSVRPLIVDSSLNLNINIKYSDPSTVGSDRIANAVAGFDKAKKSVIVVDFGTATTFDCIKANGDFIGGAISPGINLFTNYMSEKTSKLPTIKTEGKVPRIGTDTEGAMRIAARIGYKGMVDAIIAHLKKAMGDEPAMYATGGLASQIIKDLDSKLEYNPSLTLTGINLIYNMNKK